MTPSGAGCLHDRQTAWADLSDDAGFAHTKLMVVFVSIAVVITAIGVTSALPGSLPRRLVHDVQNEQCRKGPENFETVALGDSLTRMNSDPGWDFLGTESWFAIDACNGQIPYGYNAGVFGDTTAQMLQRFQVDVAVHRPKLVILLGGTNDILQHIPASETISHLRALIRASQATGAKVAIGTIPPIDSKPFRSKVDPLNRNIAALAAATHSMLIDFHAAVADGDQYRTGWSSDGIHPTLEAADAMAKAAVGVVNTRH
jgi:acyl-CoA thioesterase-1